MTDTLRSQPNKCRGFTLVELLVAMTGALILSTSVFLLAKHSTALYQEESRVANASLASVIGFERLRADLARAGYMASPNVRRDPFVCGDPTTDATWPTQLRNLASVTITPSPLLNLPAVIADNGLQPHRLILAGNYTSAEAFPVRAIYPGGGAVQVDLQVQSPAMARLGYLEPDLDATQQLSLLQSIFSVGRAVRIVDKSGRHHYGTIAAVQAAPRPTLVLAADQPALVFRSGSSLGCGLSGETGALINPVSFIRYEIRQLQGADRARYAPIYDLDGPEYDAERTELVRDELGPSGDPIAGTAELIAEYAVDLRFRLTVAPSSSAPLQHVGEDSLADWAGPTAGLSPNRGPQLVRSVHAWLSVRSRAADRAEGIDVNDGPLFRIGLGPSGGAPFARVRTVRGHVVLHNQLGVTWQ